MANTKIPNKCGYCSKTFEDNEKAVYCNLVNLTYDSLEHRSKMPNGKIRIQHFGNCKPKLAVCVSCFNNMMAYKDTND